MSGPDQNVSWPVAGYAPGQYWCECRTCGQQHMADKRAWRCADCVIKQLSAPVDYAALPEVQGLIAGALAKERDEMADKAVGRAKYLEDAAKWGGSKEYLASIKGGAVELRQHAAAIRKRGEGQP